MAFLLNSQAQGVSGKMNNLPKHHGAGPSEVRGPMQLHRLHRLNAGPDAGKCIVKLKNWFLLKHGARVAWWKRLQLLRLENAVRLSMNISGITLLHGVGKHTSFPLHSIFKLLGLQTTSLSRYATDNSLLMLKNNLIYRKPTALNAFSLKQS